MLFLGRWGVVPTCQNGNYTTDGKNVFLLFHMSTIQSLLYFYSTNRVESVPHLPVFFLKNYYYKSICILLLKYIMSILALSALTSALPSLKRAAESAVRSSSGSHDLMLPPSQRSRQRPAGHLAPRRPLSPPSPAFPSPPFLLWCEGSRICRHLSEPHGDITDSHSG